MTDAVTAIASSVQAGALVLAAGFAAYTILQAKAVARQQTTFRYLERVSSPRIREIIEIGSHFWDLQVVDEPEPSPSVWHLIAAWIWPSAPQQVPSAPPGPIERGRLRYQAASVSDQLSIGELFDLYEEVSDAFLSGLLNKSIFVNQIAPELVYRWRAAHWLINYYRELPDGTLDVYLYEKWQRVYQRMLQKNIRYDQVEDSDPDAGDYALLPDLPPLIWPDAETWPDRIAI